MTMTAEDATLAGERGPLGRRHRGRAALLRAAARTLGIVFGSYVLYRVAVSLVRGELTVQLAGRGADAAVTIRDPIGLLLLALVFAPAAVLPIVLGVRPRLLHHPYTARVAIVSIVLIIVAAVTLQVRT